MDFSRLGNLFHGLKLLSDVLESVGHQKLLKVIFLVKKPIKCSKLQCNIQKVTIGVLKIGRIMKKEISGVLQLETIFNGR